MADGGLTHLIWSVSDARWFIFAVVLTGTLLIAGLRHLYEGASLAEQISGASDSGPNRHRNAALLALMAIVAVAFGGAIGPEAGILAVMAEISALIGAALARNAAEQRLLQDVGTAGALGGLYGSPPGGAMVAQENPEAPRWQLYLAGLTGLFGFLWIGGMFLPENALRITLPAHVPAADGTDMLHAIIPALLGAGVGLCFALILPALQSGLKRLGGVTVQTLIGGVAFAALATAIPILRFSGHHELEAMLHWGQDAGMTALLALALLKALALALCLASGWRGGAAFPLLFIGAAAGGAALWLLPTMPVTVALVAGMSAALTAGMGKPLAAMLIAVLILGTPAIGPLCIGITCGWAASKLAPESTLH